MKLCKTVNMATLAQLMAVPDLGLRLIYAGARDPEVSWVSTTELTDLSDFLDGGELVLTTGVRFTADDVRWRDFVASLSRARVAGIGFGVEVAHARIPEPLIAAATTYQVPLIEVPPPTPFIAVSKAIARLQVTDELRAARAALRAQQRVLSASFHATDPAGVVSAIAGATGMHVAVVDATGRPVAATAGFHAHTDDTHSLALDIDDSLRIVAVGEPLTPEAEAALTAGAIVLSVQAHSRSRASATETERWARVALKALYGDPATFDLLALLDPHLRVQTDWHTPVRVIAVQGDAEALAGWRSEPREGLSRLITAPTPNARDLAGNDAGVRLAWQIGETDSIERLLEQITSYGLDAVVGVHVPLSDASHSQRSAEFRLTSLSTAKQLYEAPRSPQVIWADEHAPPLTELFAHSPSAKEAAAQSLRKLARSSLDGEAAVLRATLESFLRHLGQRGPCAAELGIHRNTLRNRIERIERLLDRSLDSPDARAELWVALRLDDRSLAGGAEARATRER